jgi:trigger factor
MLHQLSHQGINKETYLQISGREEADIVEAGKEDAAQALRREAVLAAIIEAEGIEPTEEELLEAVGQAAEDSSPKKLLERLKSAGRLDALKEDLAQRRALDVVTEAAKPVPAASAPASS